MELPKDKQSRCRYSLLIGFPTKVEDIKFGCKRNGIRDDQIIHNITKSGCEECPYFKSKYIEYPITINEIEVDHDISSMRAKDIGKTAIVRPCAEEYKNKTYVGVFLGDLPHDPLISLDEERSVLKIRPMMNPAILVPELNKIIFGYESWWKIVENEEDLKQEITDEMIQNQWYVRAMKAMTKSEESNED